MIQFKNKNELKTGYVKVNNTTISKGKIINEFDFRNGYKKLIDKIGEADLSKQIEESNNLDEFLDKIIIDMDVINESIRELNEGGKILERLLKFF